MSSERRASVRRLPVPIALPSGRVGRGHLLRDLSGSAEPSGFVRVPGGRRVRYGMLACVAADVDAGEMLARWERDVGPVADRDSALAVLDRYVAEVARFKLGNVVELEYLPDRGLRFNKLDDTPPGGFRPRLPKSPDEAPGSGDRRSPRRRDGRLRTLRYRDPRRERPADASGVAHDDRRRMRARVIGRAVVVLGVLNFCAFWYANLILGGSALGGKVESGRHYLGDHGRYVEVSRATYQYSEAHGISVFATGLAAFVATVALREAKDPFVCVANRARRLAEFAVTVVVAGAAAAVCGGRGIAWVVPAMLPVSLALQWRDAIKAERAASAAAG